MKQIIQTTALITSLFLTANSANAAFINGFISFDGTLDIQDSAGASVPLNASFEIDYSDATALVFSAGSQEVSSAFGDFATEGVVVDDNTTTFFKDFSFVDDSGNILVPPTVDELWIATDGDGNGFRMDLSTITSVTREVGELDIKGTGAIYFEGTSESGTSYERTLGTWSFSADNGFGNTFNFSSGSHATGLPVPEPSTYAMFGTAFAILGFVGYRKRKAA